MNDRDPQTLKVEGLCSNNSELLLQTDLGDSTKTYHRELQKANFYETAIVKTSLTDNYAKTHKKWGHDHKTWTDGAQK